MTNTIRCKSFGNLTDSHDGIAFQRLLGRLVCMQLVSQ